MKVKGEGDETKENEVIWEHATPISAIALMKTMGEEVVGFPEQGNEEDADNLTKQNALDAKEGSKGEGKDKIEGQLGPCCPYIAEESTGADIHLYNASREHNEKIDNNKVNNQIFKKIFFTYPTAYKGLDKK